MEEVKTEQGKVQEPVLPKGYIKVTGYSNRATRRAQAKTAKKQKGKS